MPFGEKRPSLPEHDYVVVVRRRRRSWLWEIQRRSKPLGVQFYGDDFNTPAAAKRAGETALKAFLDALAIRDEE